LLIALAVLLAIGEFMGALSIDWPAGILLLAGAYWIRRGGIGGAILVGLVAAIEVVAVPLRGPYADWAQDRWVVEMLAVVVSLTCFVAASAVVGQSIAKARRES
jgi:hypothetical protein